MDDIIDSFSNYSKSLNIVQGVDEILKMGNFEIKEWVILDKEYSNFKQHKGEDMVTLSSPKNENKSMKVLGLSWEYERDCFRFYMEQDMMSKDDTSRGSYKGNIVNEQGILTKRMILSLVNSIYDPLGLITPVVIRAKILLKKLWCCKVDWDDPVPNSIQEEWLEVLQSFLRLKEISFKRCVKPIDYVGDPVMITFCDASELAFGACCYLRWQVKDGSYKTQLVASKSRISPCKVQSIVRLEICGAVLGKRLAQFIEAETRYHIQKRYFIVDSQVVRSMIHKQSYGLNTFVAVRIGEIQEATKPSEWYWVASELNVADWITRGKYPAEINSQSIWQNGPKFLSTDENQWPVKRSVTENIPEQRINKFIYHIEIKGNLTNIIDINRFSSYLKLIRVTVRVLSIFQNNPSFKNALVNPSSVEFSSGEKKWIKEVQSSIRKDVTEGRFKRLNPQLNEEGIYIVMGRMEYWFEHTYNNKGLILLPSDHRFSVLYALYIHNLSHLGIASIVSKIRRRIWIVKLSKIVKKIRFNCATCKKLDKKLGEQIMSPLPMERLKPYPPFFNTCLDLFGPLEIKGEVNKRSKGKSFGVIFTCMYSRAVYCDLSQNYSTDAFLLVLRRFVSIHGYPRKLFSDPGTQLVSADKELREFIKESEELENFGITSGLEWCFSPPHAPWRNGTAESLIKAVKRAIMIAIGQQVLTFSELQTVLFEVSNLVNERPIGIHPKNPEDGTYLSPNDLILGRSGNAVPNGPFKECSNLKRLTFIESLVDTFWKRWSRDYFYSLMIRPKWHTSKRNLRINDIVLIHDSNSLRGSWKLGRVSDVHPSKDDFIRKVDVQYKNNSSNKGFETVCRTVRS